MRSTASGSAGRSASKRCRSSLRAATAIAPYGGHRFGALAFDLAELRPVRFLWRPYLIRGFNLLAGEEYIGKSALECWIAAQVTRGKLPGDFEGRPAKVIFVGSDEDDFRTVVGPRLYALGADLSLVREFGPLVDGVIFNIGDHIAELDRALREEEFALVVFEQLLDVLPPMRNSTDPREVRYVTRPLRHVLKQRETAGLGTLHVNKARSTELRQRMQNSVQFNALARSTILVDATEDEEN